MTTIETFHIKFTDGYKLTVIDSVWGMLEAIDREIPEHGDAVEGFKETRRETSRVTAKYERIF